MLRVPESGKELHQWARGLVEDGQDMRKAHEYEWWQNIAVFAGDLWAEFNPHDGRLQEVPRPEHRVRLAVNLVQPVVRTEYAKILKNKPIVNCVAASNDPRAMNSAKVGDTIYNNYVEKQYNKAGIRRQALMWTLLTGMGGIFTDYDEGAMFKLEVPQGPNGPVFDPVSIKKIQEYYRDKQHRKPPMTQAWVGDLRYAALSPFQLVWDFSKINPHEGAWATVSEVYDTSEVYRRWNVEVEPKKNVQPNVLEHRMLSKIDLTGKISFNNYKNQELVIIHRMFIKPGHPFFPDGMEIIFTEEDFIDAVKYPFAHGELPISMMGHIPFPAARYPLSVVSQIKDPALELSKTESQLIENRNMVANPAWLEYDAHNLAEDAIQNKPGLRIKVAWRPGVPPPAPVQMPDMPGYVQNLPEVLKQHILEISGQGETSQGKVPAGARSGVAIAYLQEEDDTKLGPTVQEFEEMIEREAWQTLQIIAEKFELPRTVQVFQRNAEPEVFDFVGTMLQGVAGVEVQAGSALPRSKAAKQQFMFDLWDRGVVQDPRQLMEMLELTQAEQADWEAAESQAKRENAKLALGQPVEVLDWYNHRIHQYVHRQQMVSAEFDQYSDEIKKVWYDHDELHSQAMQREEMKAAAKALVTGQQPNGAVPPEAASANGMNQPMIQGGAPGAGQQAGIPGSLLNDQPQ